MKFKTHTFVHKQWLDASASGQIKLCMKNRIQISGTYNLDNRRNSFTGTITIDERENSMYYSWILVDKDGKSIGGKSLNVAFEQIPEGHDKFEFSKIHAIQGIKEYKIGRNKIIHELNVS